MSARRILAWKTSAKFDPAITAEILNQAAEGVVVDEFEKPPQVMVDGGVVKWLTPVFGPGVPPVFHNANPATLPLQFSTINNSRQIQKPLDWS